MDIDAPDIDAPDIDAPDIDAPKIRMTFDRNFLPLREQLIQICKYSNFTCI